MKPPVGTIVDATDIDPGFSPGEHQNAVFCIKKRSADLKQDNGSPAEVQKYPGSAQKWEMIRDWLRTCE